MTYMVCGSVEYMLIKGASATGAEYSERGMFYIRYAPEKGFINTWGYFSETEPVPASLLVAIPIVIKGAVLSI